MLNEAAKSESNNFGRNFTDWCIAIQREFCFNHPDNVLDLSYFRFIRFQKYLINEQKEVEKAIKRK